MNPGREFQLSDQQFGWVCKHVKDRTGITLNDTKRNLVHNRLSSRVRSLGLADFDGYFALLDRADSEELEEFVNAITTNVTSFFRENHHFEFLRDTALPEAMARNAGRRRVRIWSAGCSKGMEPYSIAMVAKEVIPDNAGWDTKILATDLDTKVLQVGRSGVYGIEAAEAIGDDRLRRFVRRGRGANEGQIRMMPELQQMISFKHLNLMETWPLRGPFDVIFCRNVVIYFDRPTQATLWSRFAKLLAHGGYLFMGHSESMLGDATFEPIGRTMYRKIGDG